MRSHSHGVVRAQVKVLTHPTYDEFQQVVGDFKPTTVYLGASASFDLNKETGTLDAFCFKGER